MSDSNSGNLFGIPRQDLIRWSLVLFIVLIGISSILDGGVLSPLYGKTALMIYITLFVIGYIFIVAAMYAIGLQPSKFDMVFVPVLLLGMVITTLSLTNLLPTVEDEPVGGGTTTTTPDAIDISDISSYVPDSNGNIITSFVTVENPSLIDIFFMEVGPTLLIVLFLISIAVALYIFIKRRTLLPELSIAKMQEYAKSEFESNKSIIEYYVLASNRIEELKGKAPQWFTPTYFSSQVQLSPGPPLSSYFNSLTNLYELARFSSREMSDDQVREAQELYQQVMLQIEEFMLKYMREEKV